MNMGPLLSFLPQPLVLPVSHVLFDCCFPLQCKLGVHGCDQNVAFEVFLRSTYLMQIQSANISGVWVTLSFSILLFSQSLSPYFAYSLSLLLLSLLDQTVFYVTILVLKVPHLPHHQNHHHHLCQHTYLFAISSILSSKTCLLSLCHHSVRPIYTHFSIHNYILNPTQHSPSPCGTKLIEDDWFFPGCSDPALATRQQELEEELSQARGLGQHRAKKLAAPAQRSLQVGGRANILMLSCHVDSICWMLICAVMFPKNV